MLLKTNMDQDKDCSFGLSTTLVAKKLKELIKKDNLTIVDLEGAGLKMLKRQYKKYVELEYHVDHLKATVLKEAQWSGGDNDLSKPRSFTKHMSQSANPTAASTTITSTTLKDFYKAKIGNRSTYKIYSDKRIISDVSIAVKKKWGYGFLTSIKVKRTDNKGYEFSYANLSRLSLNDIEDMYLPKRVEVHKFCDGTLLKVQDNLLKMLNENNLGHGNMKLKGREWTKNDIKRSEAMLEKIDKTLKHKEWLIRLE
nr:hypothetical protein [Tanacetum cinerariifolium]